MRRLWNFKKLEGAVNLDHHNNRCINNIMNRWFDQVIVVQLSSEVKWSSFHFECYGDFLEILTIKVLKDDNSADWVFEFFLNLSFLPILSQINWMLGVFPLRCWLIYFKNSIYIYLDNPPIPVFWVHYPQSNTIHVFRSRLSEKTSRNLALNPL